MSENHKEYLMPEEGDEHIRTWMGFPCSKSIWKHELYGAQKNISLIAKTISKYEPVNILVGNEKLASQFQELVDEIPFSGNYEITKIVQPINDMWLRDTGPIFVNKASVDFNFNGWGNKQKHDLDSKVARFIAEHTGNQVLSTDLVLEGGSIEVDGKGTAIITESCSLNKNRNRGIDKEQMEHELDRLLGIEKVIWLPGVKGEDITDGHTDFYARFVGNHQPGWVFLHADKHDPDTEINRAILEKSCNVNGEKIQIIEVAAPDLKRIPKKLSKSKDAALGYINFYLCNGAVILPKFGDEIADENAKEIMQRYYPNREIEQIEIDSIAIGGGGIHCCTQQEIF